jgi:hypothetical protein
MATIKNTGRQPMGFYDETHKHFIVKPGEEITIAISDGYYAKLEGMLEKCGDRKPYEISGGGGGKASPKPSDKKEEAKEPPQNKKPDEDNKRK